jgi:hypothetical protein
MKPGIAGIVLGICLAVPAVAVAGAQQEKMKTCSKEAKSKALKGDERKQFMKGCLGSKKK